MKFFFNKLELFTNSEMKLNVIGNIQNNDSLFNKKADVCHYNCVIYRGVCSCGVDHTGKIVYNANIRWKEHNKKVGKNSECAKLVHARYDHDGSFCHQ